MINLLINQMKDIQFLQLLPIAVQYGIAILFFYFAALLLILSVSLLFNIIENRYIFSGITKNYITPTHFTDFIHSLKFDQYSRQKSGAERFLNQLFPFIILIITISNLFILQYIPFAKYFFGFNHPHSLIIVFSMLISNILLLTLFNLLKNNKYKIQLFNRVIIKSLICLPALLFSIIHAIIFAKSFNLQDIIVAQNATILRYLPGWLAFLSPFSFLAFLIYLSTCLFILQIFKYNYLQIQSFHNAEKNIFFLRIIKYIILFFLLSIGVIIFLGGYLSPLENFDFLTHDIFHLAWFLGKITLLYLLLEKINFMIPDFSKLQLLKINFYLFYPLSFLAICGFVLTYS